MKCLLLILFLPLLLCSQSNVNINATVRLSADVSVVGNSITLTWLEDLNNALEYTIYKKTIDEVTWGTPLITLDGNTFSYIDMNVIPGEMYEYRIVKSLESSTGYGYIISGMEIDPVHFNGTLLMLVEKDAADSIAGTLTKYKNVLKGEGWKIKQINISKDSSAAYVKSLVIDMYQKTNDLNTLLILGHVPVPYSGNIVPDGHNPDHRGAWPADSYYSDIDGNWTDTFINFTEANRTQNHNIPGDGKFDQSTIPSTVELAIGRVDFFDLPVFTESEFDLLRAYIEKDLAFRTTKFKPIPRAVIEDNFNFNEAFGQSALRGFSNLVHTDSISYGDFDEAFDKSHLFAYGAGGGSYSSAGGIANSAKFASNPLRSVFTMLFGSYFGDYDSRNNFMRSSLASGDVLSCSWAGRPHWYYHPLGMGATLGACAKLTQDNRGLYVTGFGANSIHVNLLGDPTLKAFAVSPPSNLIATEDNGHILLEWSASNDDIVGYYLYKKIVGGEDFELVDDKLITNRFYIDSCQENGLLYEYLVRACKLELTPSGSYFNLSGGPTYQIMPSTDFSIIADFDLNLVGDKVISANNSINADDYVWLLPDGSTSDSSEICYFLSDFDDYNFTLIASNQCKSDSISTSILYSSLDDYTYTNIVYPNPTQGLLLIAEDYQHTTIAVFNTLGEEIIRSDNFVDQAIDLSEFSSGIYVIQLINGTEKVSQKVYKY